MARFVDLAIAVGNRRKWPFVYLAWGYVDWCGVGSCCLCVFVRNLLRRLCVKFDLFAFGSKLAVAIRIRKVHDKADTKPHQKTQPGD